MVTEKKNIAMSNHDRITEVARKCQIDTEEILYRGLLCGVPNQFSVAGLLDYFEFDLLALSNFYHHVENSKTRDDFKSEFTAFVKEMVIANRLR